jgi:hypothetical protein
LVYPLEGEKELITIVSGLPRSGTSMMMQMIEAGGMQLLIDNIRKPDKDNPKGYYEYEKVKKIRTDISWLDDAESKAVKMVYSLLYDLPKNRYYKVIFMKRNMEEVLASQNTMLKRMGRKASSFDKFKLKDTFEAQIKTITSWLAIQENVDTIYVSYNAVIQDPEENALKINHFLRYQLAIKKMIRAIDDSLYRQRARKLERT